MIKDISKLIQEGRLSLVCEMKDGLPEFQFGIDSLNPHQLRVPESQWGLNIHAIHCYQDGDKYVLSVETLRAILSARTSDTSPVSFSAAFGWGLVLPFRIGYRKNGVGNPYIPVDPYEIVEGDTVLINELKGTKYLETYIADILLPTVDESHRKDINSASDKLTKLLALKGNETALHLGIVDRYYHAGYDGYRALLRDCDCFAESFWHVPSREAEHDYILRPFHYSGSVFMHLFAVPTGSVKRRKDRLAKARERTLASGLPQLKVDIVSWAKRAGTAMVTGVSVEEFVKEEDLAIPEKLYDKLFVHAAYVTLGLAHRVGKVHLQLLWEATELLSAHGLSYDDSEVYCPRASDSPDIALRKLSLLKGYYMAKVVLLTFNKTPLQVTLVEGKINQGPA